MQEITPIAATASYGLPIILDDATHTLPSCTCEELGLWRRAHAIADVAVNVAIAALESQGILMKQSATYDEDVIAAYEKIRRPVMDLVSAELRAREGGE